MRIRQFLALILALSGAINAFALRIESGNDIRITTAVHEDLYVFGNSITIDGPVYGDIYCAGGTVTVNDSVYGDLVVAGGNVYLRGMVLDDVRAAGGTLTVSGSIAGDLLIAGGTVYVEPAATIGGDLALSGGTATLGSHITGSVQASGGTVVVNGAIDKSLTFNGGELTLNGVVNGAASIAATKLTIGNSATLKGNVRYWTDKGEVDFGSALQNGAIATFDPNMCTHFERPDAKYLGFASIIGVLWYLIASAILIWLLQWLFAKPLQKAAETAQAAPMRALGYGFLYFAAVPVGIVLLLITIVGIPVGLIGLFLYILFFALANVITALAGAHWINTWKNYNWRSSNLIAVALGLLIVLKIVTLIPLIGWVCAAMVIMIAFGAILLNTNLFGRKTESVRII